MKDIMLEIRENALSFFRDSGLMTYPHMHKEIEIIYVKKGRALCYADNNFYEIGDGDLFIAFPNQVHYYMNSEIGEYHVLIFPVDILYKMKKIFFNNIPVSNIIHAGNGSPISIFVNDIINQTGDFKETVQVGLVNQLIPICLSNITIKDKIQTSSSNLQKILDYCSQNFMGEITLDSVAAALHFSKYHISHLLNQKLNIGFNKYINTLRINEAIKLMKYENKSIAYISEDVGFGSIRSFNRAFLELMNTTPSSYYKQIRSPQV